MRWFACCLSIKDCRVGSGPRLLEAMACLEGGVISSDEK